MVQVNINFNTPYKVLKKINSIFNLDTLHTDEYELICINNISDLDGNSLDIFDSSLVNKESINYTRPSVNLTVQDTYNGYLINSSEIEVLVSGTSSIAGLIIVKKSTQDILAYSFNFDNFNAYDNFNVSSFDKLCELRIE